MHNVCTSVFLISLYGAPLAQRASYLALHSSLFGPDEAVNYEYIVTNSINSLLMAQDVFTMAHTSKTLMYIYKINYSVLYCVCYYYNYVPLFVLCCVFDVLHAVRAS